jgi:plastocyanin
MMPEPNRMVRAAALVIALMTNVLCQSSASWQQTPHHEFTIIARRYAFEPAALEVHLGDLVKVTVHAEDIPHSFVVDAYRIAKKATPEHSITFEFLADRPGAFVYYCDLHLEDGCRDMKGRLVVGRETTTPER